MTLRRNSKRNLHESQEWLPRSTPLRSDGSRDGQAGRLDHVSGGQKALKTKLNLKEYYQAQVHCGQLVLVVVKQEVGPHERWLKKLKWESKMTRGCRGSYLKMMTMMLMMSGNHCAVPLCNSNTEYWRLFPPNLVFIVLPSCQQWGVGGVAGYRWSMRYIQRNRVTIITIIFWLACQTKAK